jgi:ADP-glucose pyrophosphorylase
MLADACIEQSLYGHQGTGKPWDLSRKNDGLYLLPPFSVNSATMWGNRIDAIFGNIQFLNQSNQDYVLMSDCNQVLNMDYEKLFDAHEHIVLVGLVQELNIAENGVNSVPPHGSGVNGERWQQIQSVVLAAQVPGLAGALMTIQ